MKLKPSDAMGRGTLHKRLEKLERRNRKKYTLFLSNPTEEQLAAVNCRQKERNDIGCVFIFNSRDRRTPEATS